jgi:hypothetical protein
MQSPDRELFHSILGALRDIEDASRPKVSRLRLKSSVFDRSAASPPGRGLSRFFCKFTVVIEQESGSRRQGVGRGHDGDVENAGHLRPLLSVYEKA